MNKYRITIITGLMFLFFSAFEAFSQDDKPVGAWKTGWRLEAGGGVQTLFSSDVTNLSFTQRFTPSVSLGVGKWLSPFWGLRLQASGYSLNGFSTTEGTYLADPLGNGLYGSNDPVREQVWIRPDGSYRHYLRYLNVQLAVEASLFNGLGGYKENRKWDIIPALGVGYLRSFGYKGTPATDNLSLNLSLRGKYALNPRWDVNLEVSAAAFDGNFDGRITQQKYEAYSGITLGISYNFTKLKYKKNPAKAMKQAAPPVVNNIHTLSLDKIEERLSNIEKKLDKLESTPVKTVERVIVEKEKEPEKKEPFVLASILFGRNKTKPFKGQDIDLINVVKYLEKNPEVKIRLEGYGDKATGTPEQNLKVSTKRVDNLRRLLIDTYGIDSGRIETQAIGSDYQPYEKNEWNRVVIVSVLG
jgi:outer membrane protein OmpA-like peptidoglycan-associated protein